MGLPVNDAVRVNLQYVENQMISILKVLDASFSQLNEH
jgi:hypothetical protein